MGMGNVWQGTIKELEDVMYFIIREEIYVCTVCMENERETSGRRITDMSSFNEISTDQLGYTVRW
jgi:predicted RNA-binding protein